MQIIRPYGQSYTEENNHLYQRRLLDKGRKAHNIPQFAEGHDELVIAQWISVIDKIARKPKGKDKPTLWQCQLREDLGWAAWLELRNKLCLDNAERTKYLQALWRFKVHPYGIPQDDDFKNDTNASKGRWYQRFVGDIELEAVTDEVAKTVAERIAQHLYENELRLGMDKPRQFGKIPAQSESIRDNVLKPHRATQDWTTADEQEYAAAGDVAAAIHSEASKRTKDKKAVRLEIAGRCLFDHWAKVFLNPTDGKVMDIKQANAAKPGLFALHLAVKDTYTRILKHHHKKDDAILRSLPADMEKLYTLVGNKQQNRDLAGLVQLGKVIYYTDAEKAEKQKEAEKQAGIPNAPSVPPTPEEVQNSRFWGSDGQAEIKRAEAFVRVWRHVIGQANLTLASWASMQQPFKGDILGDGGTHQTVTGKKNFDAALFDKNIALVFGTSAHLFTTDDSLRKAAIKSAISGMIALRNTALHFRSRTNFLAALEDLPNANNLDWALLETPIKKLWETANKKRTHRLLATLQGAHVLHFCNQKETQQLVDTLSNNSSNLPLPRFLRVLLRNENTNAKTGLPSTVNRSSMEEFPAIKCQYITLKLLYERAFRPWLEKHTTASDLNYWIDKALERTTKAAKDLNAKDADKRLLVKARAENLPRPQTGEDIRKFFFILSAETASEMRVQRGYESDADKAREQAEYIDDLLCDVMAWAFTRYLHQNKLDWLLKRDAKAPLPTTPLSDIGGIRQPAAKATPKPWQPVLYFLLHLMPVGEVSQLLHQLAKWEITACKGQTLDTEEKQRLDALQYTLKLYLDMHDSQYTSTEQEGKSMPKIERETLNAFIDFYEHRHVFDLAFPEQGDGRSSEQYLPQRGLREIRRFGHIPVLKALVGDNKISAGTINACLDAEKVPEGKRLSAVATAQQQRETLHSQWIKAKRGFTSYREYASALRQVVGHRHAANQSRLVDHVTAHRLVMKVLARLADFSGLFERDITFVTLALLYEYGLQPSDLFMEKGLEKFNNGQIFEALTGKNCANITHQNLLDELERHLAYERNKNIRNALAHFNMLHSERGQLKAPLDLTSCINQTRKLMAYDRKLKNAVTQSVQEMLEREGFDLQWKMDKQHQLYGAVLQSRTAKHLGDTKLRNGYQPVFIAESLHSYELVDMLAEAFGGTANPNDDITTLDFETVAWDKVK
jgi:hypothetical protein